MNFSEPQSDCNKILITDDDPDELFATGRILEKAGYTVEKTDSGRKGIEKARQFLPELEQ